MIRTATASLTTTDTKARIGARRKVRVPGRLTLIHRFGGLWQAAVHQQEPVLALQDGDVSPSAAEQGQLRADRVQLESGRGLCGCAPRQPKCRRNR